MEDTPKPVQMNHRLFRPKKLTTADIREGCIKLYGEDNVETELCISNEELRQGLDYMDAIDKSITVFGSARTPETDPYYAKARRIAYRAANELDVAVVTGGGPGIMEAANRGAYEANGKSIGMQIILPHEQITNKYLTDMVPFYFFYNRKTVMRFASEVYLFFPGGYGTLDELMEALTLVQTGKTAKIPLILVGRDYWGQFDAFIKKDLEKEHMIGESDPGLYHITDDEDEILDIIKKAPKREGN